MRTVSMDTIISMRAELVNFKKALINSLENGTNLPMINSKDILEKYIKISVLELRPYMSLAQARKMSRNTLSINMEEILK
jgi:ribosome-binding protein aMBF1 (putative translation factor)